MPANKLLPMDPVKKAGTPARNATGSHMDDERRYRAQDALNTIVRAESHKRDKGLMRDVKCLAADAHKAINGRKK